MARRTAAELAADELRARIVHGDYPEGTALRQDALATELGVSRIPIREALRQLEAEGLVTLIPHAGALVSSLSPHDIGELFDLRALVETDMLRRAVPRLSEEDFVGARAILEESDASFRRGDVAEWGVLNWRFHSALLAPANRPLSMAVLRSLHNQGDRYMRAQLMLTHGELRSGEEHGAILDAAREGDVDRACRLLWEHVQSAGHTLMDFLEKQRRRANERQAVTAR